MAVQFDLRGKTPEQKKVLSKYFSSGCALFAMKDAEYDEIVASMKKNFDARKKAIGKIGLDEEEIKEIPPVNFSGFEYGSGSLAKLGKDGRWRSSKFSETWLFFSSTQVYMYSVTLDTTSGEKKERTEEYFYKDITNFSTSSETEEFDVATGCQGKGITKKQVEYSRFQLTVPGDKFYCSTTSVANIDQIISGMKAKLREKKA